MRVKDHRNCNPKTQGRPHHIPTLSGWFFKIIPCLHFCHPGFSAHYTLHPSTSEVDTVSAPPPHSSISDVLCDITDTFYLIAYGVLKWRLSYCGYSSALLLLGVEYTTNDREKYSDYFWTEEDTDLASFILFQSWWCYYLGVQGWWRSKTLKISLSAWLEFRGGEI